MKRVVLVLNGKGGVGKSFFAVNLIQFFKDRKIAHLAIDTDNENSTLKRFHPDAQFIDLVQPRRLDGIFEALDRIDLVIVDCRAASTELFLGYFTEINLSSVLQQLKASLTLAMPINHEADSVDQVQRVADRLGTTCNYLIIRNAAHSESFALYESTEVRGRILGELKGREIGMSKLKDWLVECLNSQSLCITAALDHPLVNLIDRQRLRCWQRQFYENLDSGMALLLPTKDSHA